MMAWLRIIAYKTYIDSFSETLRGKWAKVYGICIYSEKAEQYYKMPEYTVADLSFSVRSMDVDGQKRFFKDITSVEATYTNDTEDGYFELAHYVPYGEVIPDGNPWISLTFSSLNFFVNSPSYYTYNHGVIGEIYAFCDTIARSVNIRNYTSAVNTVAITPIIAPLSEIREGRWQEHKIVSIKTKMADISLHLSYEEYEKADIAKKKKMVLDNILRSLEILKSKLGAKFDCDSLKKHILSVAQNVK